MGKIIPKQYLYSQYNKKGFENKVYFYPASCFCSNISKVFTKNKNSCQRNDIRNVTEAGYRGCAQSCFPRFLQQSFSGREKGWGSEASNKSQGSKYIHRVPTFQNGDQQNCKAGSKSGGICDKNRFEGCIFSHSNKEGTSEVPAFHMRRAGLPVHSHAIRPLYSPTSIYTSHEGSNRVVKESLCQGTCVSGRSVESCKRLCRGICSNRKSVNATTGIGFSDKFPKVCFDPVTAPPICRAGLRSGKREGFSNIRDGREINSLYEPLHRGSEQKGERFFETIGYNEFHGGHDSLRKVTHEAIANIPAVSMEDAQGSIGQEDTSVALFCESPKMVASKGQANEWSEARSTTSESSALHRCLRQSMGSSFRRSYSSGALELRGAKKQHQLEGIDGGIQGRDEIQGTPKRSQGLNSERQHLCGPVHKEPRRHSLTEVMCNNMESVELHAGQQHRLVSEAYPRSSQCDSGQAVQAFSSNCHRVDIKQTGFCKNSAGHGAFDDRSVCNKGQQNAGSFCVPSAGSTSKGSGCTLDRVERNAGNICVPTCSNNTQSSAESKTDRRFDYHSDSASLANSVMVPSPSRAGSRLSEGIAKQGGPVEPVGEQHGDMAPKPRAVQLSRLENIQQQLVTAGFSQEAADRIARPQRKSTLSIYEGKWKCFLRWCHSRGIDSINATIPQLAEFFIDLFQEDLGGGRKRAVKTIEGFRSALSMVFTSHGRDIGNAPAISQLMKNFSLERPVHRRLVPQWNLALVLFSLIESPFEPILKASLENLTLKTVFLVALASGRRRSEVHALSFDEACIRFSKGLASVTLLTEPGFLAKNQVAGKPSEKIVIPSLISFTGKDISDYKLCPVRALKAYVTRTSEAEVRNGRKRLFIPFKVDKTGEITASTISYWISRTIRKAYDNSNKDLQTLSSVRAHELRALSASWAYFNGVPMNDIMQSAYWRGHSTFSDYYLRSLANQADDLYSLGPIVVNQQVVEADS